jgi:phenylalanyl-tRNA synthetase beta chain
MRVSYRWLQDLVKLEMTVRQVIDELTMAGLDIESCLDLGASSKAIVICEIQDIRPHPNADNLVLCQVRTNDSAPLQIVCGAKNIQPGDRVPLALPGAKLPSGMAIKKAKIRGETSEGMLCSGMELSWNSDASGILILPPEMPVGEPFDALLEIKVTPNRPDWLSIFGIARELASRVGKKVFPPTPRFQETMDRIDGFVKIGVVAKHDCPRYTARLIRNVKIKPSPLWLVRALESAGLRSVNDVVDVTNYVLLELGHPLHAFDLDKIGNHQIIVRNAKDGEVIQTLDGESYELKDTDLLITDPSKPIALAGIMGCKNTEISDTSTNILLECAYFTPLTIRRTSKRLNKQTDSSYRFERGTDRERLPLALNRATQLIKELAGGDVAKGTIDVMASFHPEDPIPMNISTVNSMLGTGLSSREIADKLVNLGFEIRRSDRERMMISVPSYRVDVHHEVDLIEEVARAYGYDKIRATLPYLPARPTEVNTLDQAENSLVTLLVNQGFSEVITFSFIGREQLTALGLPDSNAVELLNPLAQNQSVMRTSMVPSIVETVRFNMNRDISDIKIFEIGKVYSKTGDESFSREETWLIVAMAGLRQADWKGGNEPCDFYDIKGIAELLLASLGVPSTKVGPLADVPYLHPKRAAKITYGDIEVCRFGEFHPELQQKFELHRRLYLLEMNLESVLTIARPKGAFAEVPRFPGVTRDLAVVVDEDVPAIAVEQIIARASQPVVEEVKLFDLYRGDQIPEGKKSLAYSIRYRASDRTLTDEEVNQHQEAIIKALKEEVKATLR